MKTAVVVLNTNDSYVALKYLKKISSYDIFNHIILTDNHSTDKYIRKLKKYCDSVDKIDFVLTDGNRGYFAGNNIGARYAIENYDVDVVFISNSDIICEEENVKKIVEILKSNEGNEDGDTSHNIGVATGLVYNFDSEHNPKIFSSFAYEVPTYRDMIITRFPILFHFLKWKGQMYYDVKKLKKSGLMKVGCVSGCFFAIKASVLKEMGYFDEDVFLYCEESIIGHTMRKLGYGVYIVLDAPIYHDEDPKKLSTIKKYRIRRTRELNSAKIYIKKYLNVRTLKVWFFVLLYHIGGMELFLLTYVRPWIKKFYIRFFNH